MSCSGLQKSEELENALAVGAKYDVDDGASEGDPDDAELVSHSDDAPGRHGG